MRPGSHYVYAKWSKPMFGGVKVANFEAFDSHVALIMNRQHALPAGRGEMRCVEGCGLAGIALNRDESIRCVTGCLDIYEFFVDPTAHVDGTARTRDIRRMLNRAPRRRLRTGI